MAQITKRKLSASTDGRSIPAVATTTPGTLIHTAVTGVVAGTWDEIWIYATNQDSVDRTVNIELGGTVTGDQITMTIPSKQGRMLLIDGAVLQNGVVVRAFASAASVINISGYVNAITA